MESVLETLSKAGAVPESARATIDGSIERVSHACAKQVAVAVESLSTYTDFASKHMPVPVPRTVIPGVFGHRDGGNNLAGVCLSHFASARVGRRWPNVAPTRIKRK